MRGLGPPRFRDPAVDHIDEWLGFDIWALFDNDGNSLVCISKRVIVASFGSNNSIPDRY